VWEEFLQREKFTGIHANEIYCDNSRGLYTVKIRLLAKKTGEGIYSTENSFVCIYAEFRMGNNLHTDHPVGSLLLIGKTVRPSCLT
jgi:hypothetical protein